MIKYPKGPRSHYIWRRYWSTSLPDLMLNSLQTFRKYFCPTLFSELKSFAVVTKMLTVFPRIVSVETILFLNLTLCSVTFGHRTYRCGNYSREEIIQGQKLFAEIRYFNFKIVICLGFGFYGGRWKELDLSVMSVCQCNTSIHNLELSRFWQITIPSYSREWSANFCGWPKCPFYDHF